MKQTVSLLVKWQVKPEKLSEVMALLPDLVKQSREETGNLSYTISQSKEAGNVLFLHEVYTNPEALEQHKLSEHYTQIVQTRIIPCLLSREVIPVETIFP